MYVDGDRFIYFPSLKRHINDLPNDNRTDSQSFQKLFLNIIQSVVEQFLTKSSKFRELEETAKFMRFSDSMRTVEQTYKCFH